MSNPIALLGSRYIDAFEAILKRFGTAKRTKIILEARNRLFEEFSQKEERYLKRFLGDDFEEYQSAPQQRKNRILLDEITACAQEIMPYHMRTLYDLFAKYMNIPFVPFNLRSLVRNIIIEEAEPGAIKRLKCASQQACIFYLSNHISNIDELGIGYFVYDYNLQTPVFIAGKNLFKGASRIVLPILNASVLDRERMEAPRRDVLRWEAQAEFMATWAKHKMDILGFLTGGRPYDGDQAKKPNVAAGFIKALAEAVNRGYPVYIEPISLSYTRVPEDKRLYERAIDQDHKGARHSNLFWGWLNVNWAFHDNPLYITIHKPISLEEYLADMKDPRAIAEDIARRVYAATKIPAEKLLAAAAAYQYSNGTYRRGTSPILNKPLIILDTGEIINTVADIREHLVANNANLEKIIRQASPAELVKYGSEKYKRRHTFSDKSNIGSLLIPEEEIGVLITNANHIKHKLPAYMQEALK
jgi:glycerol-3-phosphate O-acyltransferase